MLNRIYFENQRDIIYFLDFFKLINVFVSKCLWKFEKGNTISVARKPKKNYKFTRHQI